MIIDVKREDTKVVAILSAGLPDGASVKFEWEASHAIHAEAIVECMRDYIGDVVQRDRRSHYEEGYRDGLRDARSHRPARKRTWFERKV